MKNPKHELKRKKVRKLMRFLGLKSEVWIQRKKAIKARVAKQQLEAHERALKRKAEKAKQMKGGNMSDKKSPCPPTGPAHDGSGKGKGKPGGSRRGKRTIQNPNKKGGK